MKLNTTIRGVDDVDHLLTQLAPKEAKNLARSTVHGAAGEVAKQAKRAMPEDEGVLKKSTRVKRARGALGKVQSNVVVTKAAFYWRFIEYGQGPDHAEYAMFAKAAEWFRKNRDQILIEQFGKKLEKRLVRLRKVRR